MTTSPDTAFEGESAAKFADYAEALRGYVRYELVHRNLAPFVGSQTLEVIDVGGGSAADAIWLAEQGHNVTVLEPAADQLKTARQRLKTVPRSVRQRVRLQKGTLDSVDPISEGTYDLALAHGVAMYVSSPAGFIKQLAAMVKPGTGMVSSLEKGFYGAQARLLAEGRLDELPRLIRESRLDGNLGFDVRAFYPSELQRWFKEAGLSVKRWSGVRVMSDGIRLPATSIPPELLKAVVESEDKAGNNPETKAMGQMLHFIGRRVLRP